MVVCTDGEMSLQDDHRALLRSSWPKASQSPAPASGGRLPSGPPSSHASREFRRLIDAFHDGVLVATATGIVYANHALLQLLGYDGLNQLLSEPARRLIKHHLTAPHRGLIVKKLMHILRRSGAHEELQQPVVTRGGMELDIHFYFDSIQFESHAAVMITLRDMTESLIIQEKLNRAERLASIGTLAAGVAHEINNPLAYVTTNLAFCMERIRYIEELLEGRAIQLGNPASLRAMLSPMVQALTEAHQGTSRVATIVRDLRALTRDDKDVDAAADLAAALSSAIHMSESESRFVCRIEPKIDEVGAVCGNETRLVQIFLNLIINAAQSFETDNRNENVIRVEAWRKGEVCIVEVHDNGRGIPSENIDRIFDPFFTTKPVGVGTGLGLSICHGLVEAIGGTITVRSELGIGTSFHVRLRASSAPLPQSARRFPSLNPAHRARVLIVDDEPLILRSVARLLRDQHDVETAKNGREALLLLSEQGPFDLVVCDLMMPEMTGMELYGAVLDRDPATADRFVFLTGGAYTDLARQFLNGIGNPKLDKPIQPNLLRSVVSGVLRGNHA